MEIKGAYWRSSEADSFPPETIIADYFTHIFYATVAIDARTHQLSTSAIDHQWMDKFTSTLHEKNLKCVLSIGVPKGGPNALSSMASTHNGRLAFIGSTIHTARKHSFDGLDLYWKYPKTLQDMSNLALLFEKWHEALERDSSDTGKPRLSLSAVVYFAPNSPDNDSITYPFQAIVRYVDFVNLVCYDYGSSDTTKTAGHALLCNEEGGNNNSTDYGITTWIRRGRVPADKLVMGLPLYGKTWSLEDATNNGIGAPANGLGPGDDNGVMDYDAISNFNDVHGAELKENEKSGYAYSFTPRYWIGYDNATSISAKIQYARNFKLKGYFFWAIGMDRNYQLPAAASSAWDGNDD